MRAEHGHTPAAWTAVTIILAGFVVGAFGVVLAQPWLAIVGAGVIVIGTIVGKIMQMMGLGKPAPADPIRGVPNHSIERAPGGDAGGRPPEEQRGGVVGGRPREDQSR
jgi:hypothetical protein